MPVAIEVVGPFDGAEAFVKALQTGDRRYLVDGLASTAEKPAAAAGGKPATVERRRHPRS